MVLILCAKEVFRSYRKSVIKQTHKLQQWPKILMNVSKFSLYYVYILMEIFTLTTHRPNKVEMKNCGFDISVLFHGSENLKLGAGWHHIFAGQNSKTE